MARGCGAGRRSHWLRIGLLWTVTSMAMGCGSTSPDDGDERSAPTSAEAGQGVERTRENRWDEYTAAGPPPPPVVPAHQRHRPDAPILERVEPAWAHPGDDLVLHGGNFGEDPEAVTVWIGRALAPVDRRSDTRIDTAVPVGARVGTVRVSLARGASGTVEFLLLDVFQPGALAPRDRHDLVEATQGSDYVAGELYIELTPRVTETRLDELLAPWPHEKVAWTHTNNAWTVRFTEARTVEDLRPIFDELGNQPEVSGIMLNRIVDLG